MTQTGLFHWQGSGQGLHPRVYAYYFKQWNGFRMPYHHHASTEIMYVMSGTCRVEIGALPGVHPNPAQTASFVLNKGEFIVIGVEVPHRLIVDRSCRMLNVEFALVPGGSDSGPSIQQLAEGENSLESLLSSSSTHLVLRDPEEVYHSLKSLVLELDGHGQQMSGMARMLLAQLLIRIARLRTGSAENVPQADHRYIRQSVKFLQHNYDRDIRVKDVAAAVNLHPGYLQRIFKSVTGRTLVDTLTSIRIEKARMLLRQTNIPVTDIYAYVGIGSRQYFHSLFKKHTSLTPLEYRDSTGTELWNYSEK